MGKVTKSIPHLSKEEVQERIKGTVGFWRVQKWLVIWNALVDPRPAGEIALHTGLAEQSVHNLISRYNRLGPEVVEGPGKGGRRRSYLSWDEETFSRIIQTGGSYWSDRYCCRNQGGFGKTYREKSPQDHRLSATETTGLAESGSPTVPCRCRQGGARGF